MDGAAQPTGTERAGCCDGRTVQSQLAAVLLQARTAAVLLGSAFAG